MNTTHIKDILYIKKNNQPFFNYNLQHYTSKIEEFEVISTFDKLQNFTCINCPYLQEHYNQVLRYKLLENKYNELKKDISDENLQLFEDYNKKIDFLIINEYIDTNHNITLKGRIACEIKTADEIFVTEMAINNMLYEMNSADIMKLMSGFVNFEVCDENDEEVLKTINTVLQQLKSGTKNNNTNIDKSTNTKITNISTNIKNDKNSDKNSNKKTSENIFSFYDQKTYIDSYEFKFGNAYNNAVFDWCNNKSILEIIQSYKISEGTLVRVILRLEEFCKEMVMVCDMLNDIETKSKIERCMQILKRELTMSVSLYFD
ncbi:Antiviral helicase ski2 [Binucleata daphniae]